MRTDRSITFSDKNNDVLEFLKNERNIEPSKVVNDLVRCICRPPKPVRDELLRYLNQTTVILYKKLDGTSEKLTQDIIDQIKIYNSISKYLNSGSEVFDDFMDTTALVRIELDGAYLAYPLGWIVLNEELSKKCRYALSCEIKDERKIPHFIYLHNHKRLGDLGDDFYKSIFDTCCLFNVDIKPEDYRKMRFYSMPVHTADKPEHFDSTVVEDED